VGNDLKFHLWTEDPSQAPNSGRRFRRLSTIASAPRVPFVSLDLKNVDNVYTYLALIDRQGLLSIYEPSNPDDFRDWTLIDQWNVCVPAPGRGEETSFKVRWDQNITPLPYINSVSNDRNQLSLVVTALDQVKIYRSVPNTTNGLNSDGTTHRLIFYEAARLPKHPALVRDVQWAPFSVRGVDRIATACQDGAVRIFEIGVSERADGTSSIPEDGAGSQRVPQPPPRLQPQSSLTSAITGRNNNNSGLSSATTSALLSDGRQNQPRVYNFPFEHTITQVANIDDAHRDAWALAWDGQGQVLMSSGSDGVTKVWRKSVMGGQWLLFADQAVDLGDGDASDADEPDD